MLLVAGLFLAGFFSSAEPALTALGEARVQHLSETRGWRGSLLRLWQRHPERILSALLLGATLVNVGMGSITALIAEEMGLSNGLVLLTGITTLVLLIFGEITPKTLAKRHATGFALQLIPLVAIADFLLCPLAWLFVQIPRGLSRAIKVESGGESVA